MLFYLLYLLVIIYLCGPFKLKSSLNKKNYFNKRKYGYILAIFLIIIISSIRYGIGFDWHNYDEIIAWYGRRGLNLTRYEFFDNFIFYIGGVLNNSYISFAIFAVLTYGILAYYIKKYSGNKFESLIIYMSLFYLPSLSTIRQALAVVIVFSGYRFIREKKALKYAVTVLIAMGFHSYAFIGFVLYPLYYVSIKALVLLGLGGLVIFNYLLPIFVAKFMPDSTFYLASIADSSGNFQKIVYAVVLIYCICLFFLTKKQNIKDELYYNEALSLIKVCSFGALLPFLLGGHTGGRVAEYFLIYYILVVPLCNKYLNLKIRVITLIPFTLSYFGYLYATLSSGEAYIPFVTLFNIT